MNIIKDLTSFIKTAKNPLIVILGPTASGKTTLSLKLAKLFGGEIISTDSRQIYKEMEIGTAAILPNEMQGITHHMLSITTPDKTLSLAEYKDMATQKIKEIQEQNHVPFLVGGTGLYISAITEGYDVPRIPADEKLRAKLYAEAEKYGNEHVHKKLQKLDPEAATRIHPNNVRYVVRAIEIATHSPQPQSKSPSPYDVFMIGINYPREQLYDRINKRVDEQIASGLIDEVASLLKKYDPQLPAMLSLGVKEIIPYVRGESPLEECLETLKKNTRNYAKRQMTWFRRYDNVRWLDLDEVATITSTDAQKIP